MKNTSNPRLSRGFFRFSNRVFLLIGLVGTLSLVSCNDMDTIGLDLVETRIKLNSSDTTTIIAYTLTEDSLITTNASLHLLGIINDPLFGKTRATIYTEALPRIISQSVQIIHPDSLVIDSVVISLAYAGYSGDINTLFNVRVFELGEIMPLDSVYSNKTLQTKKEIAVNNPVFKPMSPRDTVYLGPDSLITSAHLRINLEKEYGRQMIRFFDSLTQNQKRFTTTDQFRAYLSGFQIEVEETNLPGAMIYFNLTAANSRFQIFYSKVGTTNSYTFDLPLGDALGRRFTRFENYGHQHAAQIIRSQVIDKDTLQGDSLLFLQSMANYRVRIQLPYLNNLLEGPDEQIAVNSARLVLPIETNLLPDSINTASALILYREDPDNPGKLISLDDQFVSPGYFGGFINRGKMEYSFNITKHLQKVIEDPSMNTPLYLRVSNGVQNAGRIALKGPKRDNPMRLEIMYTQPVIGSN